MTTTAKQNVSENRVPLPAKIEHRLAELLALGEFDQGEVNWCRAAYWGARDDWHKILIACYDEAQHCRKTKTGGLGWITSVSDKP